ncbi:hypothetical protein [Paenibacillus caseinilyticus]|uniref:hypothetical protein n=1 Tax=Paenibacillus caseinilyticus TaxID=3098138 RepID=UPI0022B88322|nr:hypothetical protein [Paenibacillus caseinilyticus]MCZ8522295.1 hypothetical protein [Paenibacillus caseinilyticus]
MNSIPKTKRTGTINSAVRMTPFLPARASFDRDDFGCPLVAKERRIVSHTPYLPACLAQPVPVPLAPRLLSLYADIAFDEVIVKEKYEKNMKKTEDWRKMGLSAGFRTS